MLYLLSVDMTSLSSCIEFKTSFAASSFRADETARVDVHVRNGTTAPLPLSSLSLVTTSDQGRYSVLFVMKYHNCDRVFGIS